MRNYHRFSSMKEVQEAPAYGFFCALGYSETQAAVLTMIDLDSPKGGFPAIVDAFDSRKKEDTRSFSQFFCDYVFDEARLKKDGFITERERIVEDVEAPASGGFFGRVFSKAANSVRNMSVSAPRAKKGLRADGGMVADEMMVMREPAEANMAGAVQFQAMAAPMPSQAMGMGMMADAEEAGAIEIPAPAVSIEDIRTDSYETIEEKGFKDVSVSPTSTFRTTYNTAAASVLLSNIRRGSNTRESMVRTEELLNYLSYELKKPEQEMFEVTKELGTIDGKTMLFLGIQGKKTLPSRQNICFLLDVSGSMSSRSEQMVMSIFAVLSKMNDGDIFSLVTYSSNDHVVVNGLKLRKEQDIEELLYTVVKDVYIYGATYGSAGIAKAYEIIEKNKIKDGVNRVIILTDGDLNFGITDKDGLKGLIEKKKLSGAYFSAIGTGIFNLKDDKLEALAKNGNGNYFVVNAQSDIEKNIVANYESLVYPIAKNVKAQVEFNPGKVEAYKLIGYENRMLSHEDFRDDTVIAEPFGSGSYCIALYELKLREGKEVKSGLKYQETVVRESEELATISLRYEDIEGDGFHELSFPVESDLPMTDNLKKAAECAAIAEKLRDENADDLSKNRLRKLLES